MNHIKALVLVIASAFCQIAHAATVSKSFTTHSSGSAALYVRPGDSFSYSVSGTFVGTVVLQKSRDGANFSQVGSAITGAASSTIKNDSGAAYAFRVYCSTHTSGTIVTSLTDDSNLVQHFKAKSGAAVLSLYDDGVIIPGNLSVTGTVTIPDSTVTTAKIASAAVTTEKLSLPNVTALQTACWTTAKLPGSCTSINAATGACNNCQ